jgi:sulfatase maturation enzyme AslB (radical SAM superfamily)
MSFICRAPWTSIAFQPTTIAPCCVYEYGPDHDETFSDIKSKFLSGQVPAGCNKCKQAHDAGKNTPYKGFDEYETDFTTNNIQEINIKANNFCNLACRSCGPHFSSKWEQEFGDHIVITKDTGVLEKLKQIDFGNLKMIVFAGGEPTMSDEHVFVLNHLVEIGHTDVRIRVSTNGHVVEYKNIQLIPLWKQFPNLILQLSVDAIKERAEAVRSGTDWNLVEKNIEQIQRAGIHHYANITVSALNIWFLDETVDYLKNHLKINTISYNLLYNPDILNIKVIPMQYRPVIDQVLEKCLKLDTNVNQIKHYFDTQYDDTLWQSFLIYNLMLDITRKEKLFENLPIKKNLIDQWIRGQI